MSGSIIATLRSLKKRCLRTCFDEKPTSTMSMTDEDSATMAALQRLASHGSDLSKPMKMDFCVAVPDAQIGRAIADKVRELGFEPSVELRKGGEWTCYCVKSVVPSYANVRAIEHQLDAIARPLGGYSDGFGSFGNSPQKS